jgi:hypothetical protein
MYCRGNPVKYSDPSGYASDWNYAPGAPPRQTPRSPSTIVAEAISSHIQSAEFEMAVKALCYELRALDHAAGILLLWGEIAD